MPASRTFHLKISNLIQIWNYNQNSCGKKLGNGWLGINCKVSHSRQI